MMYHRLGVCMIEGIIYKDIQIKMWLNCHLSVNLPRKFMFFESGWVHIANATSN